jgi:hypothetical protein
LTPADLDKAFEDLSTIKYEDLIHCLQPMPRVTLDDPRALMRLCESMGDPDTLGTLAKHYQAKHQSRSRPIDRAIREHPEERALLFHERRTQRDFGDR